jgi:hypothetical protein
MSGERGDEHRPGGRAAAAGERRGWRVGHRGRDGMYYEEWRDGAWQRLEIGGEMLTGRAHHVIYFASPQEWLAYPEWARDRREEIIARVKSVFRAPDYEYHGEAARSPGVTAADGGRPAPAAAGGPSRPERHRAPRGAPGRWKHRVALLAAVAVLSGIAAAMGWLVANGLDTGQTVFPSKLASQRRTVSRAQEPVTFWICLGMYSSLGAGTLGLAAWMLRAAR